MEMGMNDISVFKYERACRLESCSEKFLTNRKWQQFCCKEHQQEYWKIIRREQGQVIKELTRLKKENQEIKEKLGMA
jgi:D-lyxose ketol-isomerase